MVISQFQKLTFWKKKKKNVLSEKSSGDEEGENLTVVSYDTNQVCKIK